MRTALTLVCFLACLADVTAAQKQATTAGATVRTVRQTLWVAPTGFIRIFHLSGSLRVEGWDRDSLSVSGTVSVPGHGEFAITPGKQGARVSLWGPDETRAQPSQLIVRVPRRSQLWIKTQTANVVVSGFEGGLDVATVAGAVEVTGRPREVYIESMGGAANLVIESRSARIKTGTGQITLRGNIDDATVSTVSGAVLADDVRVRTGHFESVDGAIRFSGDLLEPASLEFINHSGDIELALSPRSLAAVNVSTITGAFQDDWGIDAKGGPGKLSGKEFSFMLGKEPLAEVIVRNFKGAVILKRYTPRRGD
ncbi:MAG: hypothetical protein ACRENP_15860 [Longimicrobiales bacterium]